jgi:hypothetical protein
MRLSQIVVNEVSLVDKAANKRKFLLYKRDGEAMKPEDILKAAQQTLSDLIEIIKAKDEGSAREGENYAQQAKDLLNGVVKEAVSFYTDAERSAIGGMMAKSVLPPEDKKTGEADELELTDEDVKQLEKLGEAVDSLQQQLADKK